MALSEFQLIHRYFESSRFAAATGAGVIVGVGDDAAVLRMPPESDLAVSIDTLVRGVHFPADMAPADIAWRSLAVNLSDMAAMGAQPLWFTLALTMDRADESWLEPFSRTLAEIAARFGVALVGGDTTRGPLTISIEIHGAVPRSGALLRSGAHPGDGLYVTGWPGLAALGLRRLGSGEVVSDDPAVAAFLRPEPRVAFGIGLRGLASAAIDVSDGLLADAGHIAERSAVALEIDVARLPLAAALQGLETREDAWSLCLSGGDDYELCFTAPAQSAGAIARLAQRHALPCTRIGTVSAGEGVHCHGFEPPRAGFDHFGGLA